MKICVTSTGDNLDSDVDPRFGRCRYFLIVDTDTMSYESISNENAMVSGGAGIQAAQTVAKVGVEILITGNVGPNAYQTLSAAGIKVFTGATGLIGKPVRSRHGPAAVTGDEPCHRPLSPAVLGGRRRA